MKSVFLLPGEFYFAETPARIQTILGSCVALTMLDPRSKQGAMCHCLLPQRPTGTPQEHSPADCFRYVDTSLKAMLAEFTKRQIPASRLEIKLFGGANVLEVLSDSNAVGSLNWKEAQRLLKHLNLAVSAHDIGGEAGRRIVFDTATGDVLVKTLGVTSRGHSKPSIRRGRNACRESAVF
jgi:chemotaxis protein CheD